MIVLSFNIKMVYISFQRFNGDKKAAKRDNWMPNLH